MPRNVLVVGGHGLGDCLLSLQCASYVQRAGDNCSIVLFTREEVFNPIKALFGHLFDLKRINGELTEEILKTDALIPKYDEVYFSIPDWLFSNPKAFDWNKYHTSPQMIKTTRLLADQHRNNGIIYLGLMTSTQGYLYQDVEALAINLAKAFPQYSIYLPIITSWSGQSIKQFEFPEDTPKNLIIEKDPNFAASLSVLRDAVYFVGTDNGPSHVAYHFGVPRLILDPQYNRLPWMARWKEDVTESIPITSSWPEVVRLVSTNFNRPETLLIPRATVLANLGTEWKKLLLNKF
jgi:hypothetical protein